MSLLQKSIVMVGESAFGEANMSNPRERIMRFWEEACELIRAGDLPLEIAQAMLLHEYVDRKVGLLPQEIGGTGVTLFALSEAYGFDLLYQVEVEMLRVHSRRKECAAKHEAKPAWTKAGPVEESIHAYEGQF